MKRYSVTLLHRWKRCEYTREVEATNANAAKRAAKDAVIATAQGWPSDYRVVGWLELA